MQVYRGLDNIDNYKSGRTVAPSQDVHNEYQFLNTLLSQKSIC